MSVSPALPGPNNGRSTGHGRAVGVASFFVAVAFSVVSFLYVRTLVPTLVLAILGSVVVSAFAGLLTYVALGLRSARSSTVLAERLLARVQETQEQLGRSQLELSQTVSVIKDGAHEMQLPEFSFLNSLADPGQVEERQRALDDLHRLFQEYKESWASWGRRIAPDGYQNVRGWIDLVARFHGRVSKELGIGEVHTSSEVYTQTTFSCAKTLKRMSIPGGEKHTTLFLITGMLPQEFYNWPQMEYVEGNSYPVCVAHTWQGAESYFKEMLDLKSTVTVKRTIVVMDQKNDAYPYVKEFRKLKEVGELRIQNTSLSYDAFYKKPGGLLRTTMGTTGPVRILAKEIRVYPVGTELDFGSSCLGYSDDLKSLFVNDLHSATDDAHYYVLQPFRPQDQQVMEFLFGAAANQNCIPEVALFKQNGEWQFGIMGLLRPFTETMRTAFLPRRFLAERSGIINLLENGPLLSAL